jgi:predicted enzyme related to lactoylglutathione lyase
MKTQKTNRSEKTASPKMNPVVHFEMPVDQRKRMAGFYAKAFGWQMKELGKENGNYVLATTTKSDKTGRPKKKGAINGGFFTRSEDKPAQYPSVVIAVDDIKKAMKKIAKAGGEVIGEPMEIPGFGSYVSFYDTEKNRVSIMEPIMEMKEKDKRKR